TRSTSTRAASAAEVRRTSCGTARSSRRAPPTEGHEKENTMATDKTETKPEAKDVKDVKEVKLAAVPAAPAAAPTPARDDKRDKAIDLAVSTIEKQFGKGSIMRLGEGMAPPEVKVVPTGSLGLDIALGVGGLPRGRIMEVYGPESSGKTTLALHVVSQAQKMGRIWAFVDAGHAPGGGHAPQR